MKKFFALTIFLVLSVVNVCSALSSEEFDLGGVQLNMPYDNVIAMYGQPTSIPGGYAQLVSNVIKYGNNVEIGFLGKKVRYVVTTANNGWKTPSGICVGMPIDKVIHIYGTNYETSTRTDNQIADWMRGKPYFEYTWTGKKYSWSRVADTYSYNPGDTKFILSVVENGGKVTAIMISQRTPEY